MKLSALALAITGVVILLLAFGFAWYAEMPGGPLQWMGFLLEDAPPTSHLALILAILIGVAAVVCFCAAFLRKKPGPRGLMRVLGLLILGLQAAAAARSGLMSFIAASETHVHDPRVVAPSVGEALLTLAIGLLASSAIFAADRLLLSRSKQET